MAATPAPERQADSAADVLAAVQAERAAADRAEVRILEPALDCLPAEGAEHVDRHVARFAHKVGIAQLDRLVEEALVRFDPAQAEQRRPESAENRQRPHSGRT